MDKYDKDYLEKKLYDTEILEKVIDYKSEQKLLREEARKLSLIDLVDYSQRSFLLLQQSHLKEEDRSILDKIEKFVSVTKDRRLQEQIYIYGQLVTRSISVIKPEEKTQLVLKLFEKATDDYRTHKKEKDGLIRMAEKQEKNFLWTAIISVIIIGGFVVFVVMLALGFFH